MKTFFAPVLTAVVIVAAAQPAAAHLYQQALDKARQCYDPISQNPTYIIDVCTNAIQYPELANQPVLYATRGVAHMRQGNFKSAIADLGFAIVIAPKDYPYLADDYSYRCLAEIGSGKPADAQTDCNLSLGLRPNNPSALDFRGDAEYMQHDYGAAIADFNAALAIDPKQNGSLYVRWLARIHNGDATGGQADIDAANAADANVAHGYPGFDKQQ